MILLRQKPVRLSLISCRLRWSDPTIFGAMVAALRKDTIVTALGNIARDSAMVCRTIERVAFGIVSVLSRPDCNSDEFRQRTRCCRDIVENAKVSV